jgi:hypothetical protein
MIGTFVKTGIWARESKGVRHMDRKIRLAVGAMAIVVVIGCGSDGNGPSHGVSESNKVDSLNQKQIDAICTDFQKRVTDAWDPIINLAQDGDLRCTIQALAMTELTGGNSTDCQSAKQRCTEALSQTAQRPENNSNNNTVGAFTPNCGTPSTYAACEATVADIDACTNSFIKAINENVDNIQSAINSISCNNVGKEGEIINTILSSQPRIPNVSQCQTIENKCPGIMIRINTTMLSNPWTSRFSSQN